MRDVPHEELVCRIFESSSGPVELFAEQTDKLLDRGTIM